MFTVIAPFIPLMLLPAQQVDPAELQKAIQQDAAAQSAKGANTPAAPLPDATLETQQRVQRPGSSLLNPALSVILDGTFGYYGKNATDFESLGLPIAGDDPSTDRQGFGVQEIELAASAAIDPYLEAAVFLTI